MDGVPLGVLNQVGAAGIAIGYTGLIFWMLLSGRLFTRHEMDARERRIEALEETVKELGEQNAILLKELPVLGSFLRGLRSAAGLGDD